VTESPSTTSDETPSLRGADAAEIVEDAGGITTDDVTGVTPDADVVDVPTADGDVLSVIIPSVPEVGDKIVVEIPAENGEYDTDGRDGGSCHRSSPDDGWWRGDD